VVVLVVGGCTHVSWGVLERQRCVCLLVSAFLRSCPLVSNTNPQMSNSYKTFCLVLSPPLACCRLRQYKVLTPAGAYVPTAAPGMADLTLKMKAIDPDRGPAPLQLPGEVRLMLLV
jgi:hypothetical protein